MRPQPRRVHTRSAEIRRRVRKGGRVGSTIRAAGVVLLRDGDQGIEVCIVRRPVRRDWSLPKGKLDAGESSISAAYRETLEETGVRSRLGLPLPEQHYISQGRKKQVDYWAASPRAGGLTLKPTMEIAESRWVSLRQAEKLLTYSRDAKLVRQAAKAPLTRPLIVLRHAEAVKRTDWSGEDALRPLDDDGRKQAVEIADMLHAFDVRSVYSSDSLRCVQTLQPYSDLEDIPIHTESLFSEEGFAEDPKVAIKVGLDLMTDPAATVICTHRPVLPKLLKRLAKESGLDATDAAFTEPLTPGGFLIIHREAVRESSGLRVTGRAVAIERH